MPRKEQPLRIICDNLESADLIMQNSKQLLESDPALRKLGVRVDANLKVT